MKRVLNNTLFVLESINVKNALAVVLGVVSVPIVAGLALLLLTVLCVLLVATVIGLVGYALWLEFKRRLSWQAAPVQYPVVNHQTGVITIDPTPIQQEEIVPTWDYEPAPAPMPAAAHVASEPTTERVEDLPMAEILPDAPVTTIEYQGESTPIGQHEKDDHYRRLQRGIELVRKEGMSVRAAAKMAQVAESTLRTRLKRDVR